MTRLRFLLVSMFAGVAACLGWKRKAEFQVVRGVMGNAIGWNHGKWLTCLMQKPVVITEGPLKGAHRMIYQWRTTCGVAMSPVFSSREEALADDKPFTPQA